MVYDSPEGSLCVTDDDDCHVQSISDYTKKRAGSSDSFWWECELDEMNQGSENLCAGFIS